MEGNTAWMLISTALVLFMVPGLALFYGGMVRSKNVLNMLNMNTYCLGIVPLVWVLVAFHWVTTVMVTVSRRSSATSTPSASRT